MVNVLRTLNPAQLRLIDEINALATKGTRLTGEETVQIVHLMNILVHSSSFPLNSERSWFRGRGKGCLAMTRRAYDEYRQEYDEMNPSISTFGGFQPSASCMAFLTSPPGVRTLTAAQVGVAVVRGGGVDKC